MLNKEDSDVCGLCTNSFEMSNSVWHTASQNVGTANEPSDVIIDASNIESTTLESPIRPEKSGNCQYGLFQEIHAKEKDVLFTGISAACSRGTMDCTVYTALGICNDKYYNASAWTSRSRGMINLPNNNTKFMFDEPVLIPAGEVMGIYFQGTTSSLCFSPDQGSYKVYFENEDISVHTGPYYSAVTPFQNTPCSWYGMCGDIYYTLETQIERNHEWWASETATTGLNSAASLWLSLSRKSVGSFGTNFDKRIRRKHLPCNAEIDAFLAQLLWVLLRCSQTIKLRLALADPKWMKIFLDVLLDDKTLHVTRMLAARLCGLVFPLKSPELTDLEPDGELLFSKLFDVIAELCVPPHFLKDALEEKMENDSKGNKKKTTSMVDPLFLGYLKKYDARITNERREMMVELCEMYRLLARGTQQQAGAEWNKTAFKYISDKLVPLTDGTIFDSNEALKNVVVALSVLGGDIEPLREGAPVMYKKSAGTISKIKWRNWSKGLVKKSKKKKESKLQVQSVKIRLEAGDYVDVHDSDTLSLLPIVEVPFDKIPDALQLLEKLTEFLLGNAHEPRSKRELVILSHLRRMSARILSSLLDRRTLATALSKQGIFKSLINLSMLNALNLDDDRPTEVMLERRLRVLDIFDNDAVLPDQIEHRRLMEVGDEIEGPVASLTADFRGSTNMRRQKVALEWNPELNSNPSNVVYSEDNTVAAYDTKTAHRSICTTVGFDSGVHEWSITILKTPCCGYVGVMADSFGKDYSHFVDQGTCVGLNNFSGNRNAGRAVGTVITIILDMDNGEIEYITPESTRKCPIATERALYPAVEGDENGTFKIELISSSWNKSGKDGGCRPVPYPHSAYAIPGLPVKLSDFAKLSNSRKEITLFKENFRTNVSDRAGFMSAYPNISVHDTVANIMIVGGVLAASSGSSNWSFKIDSSFAVPKGPKGFLTFSVNMTSQGNPGAWNIGMVLGDQVLCFHPGYSNGACRVDGPNRSSVFPNQDMGFSPREGRQYLHKVSVTIRDTGMLTVNIYDAEIKSRIFSKTWENRDLIVNGVVPAGALGFHSSKIRPGTQCDAWFSNVEIISKGKDVITGSLSSSIDIGDVLSSAHAVIMKSGSGDQKSQTASSASVSFGENFFYPKGSM